MIDTIRLLLDQIVTKKYSKDREYGLETNSLDIIKNELAYGRINKKPHGMSGFLATINYLNTQARKSDTLIEPYKARAEAFIEAFNESVNLEKIIEIQRADIKEHEGLINELYQISKLSTDENIELTLILSTSFTECPYCPNPRATLSLNMEYGGDNINFQPQLPKKIQIPFFRSKKEKFPLENHKYGATIQMHMLTTGIEYSHQKVGSLTMPRYIEFISSAPLLEVNDTRLTQASDMIYQPLAKIWGEIIETTKA